MDTASLRVGTEFGLQIRTTYNLKTLLLLQEGFRVRVIISFYMVRRLIAFFSETVSGIHAAAYVIATFALVSQILGLVRDRMLAHLFGAGPTLDVYYAAFRIPDFVFASIASVVSLFVIIPFLSERLEKQGKLEARAFLSQVTTFFCVFICVASACLWFLAPMLGRFLYPGFDVDQQQAFVQLTRILLLSPIFLGLSNILSSVTQLAGRFFVYALSPILYNLGIIVGVAFLYPTWGLAGIGWGVVIGAVMHLLIQVPTVIREGLLPRPTISFDWRSLQNVIMVSLPRTTTLALNQLVMLALLGFASTLAAGSVTVFTFASNLYMAPLTLIGVSYSVAAFPVLSKLFSNGDKTAFLDHVLIALRSIIFWSLPAVTVFIVLRAHIVRVLLGSGEFDWADTRLTAAVFALFLISLVAHGLVLLFVRAYYAAGKTARPLLVTLGSSVLTVGLVWGSAVISDKIPMLRYFVEDLLRISDVPGTNVVMIAFAYSLGLIVNASVFWVLFRRDFGGHIPRQVTMTIWHASAASILAASAAYVVLRATESVFDLSIALDVFLQGAVAGVAALMVWTGILLILKNAEFIELIATIRARFWQRAAAIAPETGEI